ncbi:hypothetical protein BDQ17DRAFT_1342908 [Cyathus striatus]|nr:hypothetical protein BDQ17DRAFT_1342908 [Cyathus striatus]
MIYPPHTLPLYGRIIPLPAQTEGEVYLHPALKHAPTPTPVIIYNLLDHPHNAVVNNLQPSHLHDWAEETATYPALSDITIHVPNLDRPIVVNVLEHQHRYPVVTLNDILMAVYRGLRIEAVQRICGGRMIEVLWEDPRHVHPEQVEDDVRRVITHMLGGRIFWDGLVPSRRECDVWTLHVR